ncbi:MAG: N-acetylneuraminate synthase family protein [Acidobacteria bacterium]|nr:N-acetylneuraminate synthase family protein [Acidobacteriota bacterium]
MSITIIAEAAQGYEGSETLACLLVRAAAVAGADLVKFQLVYADEIATPDYQHFRLFRSLEMPDDAWAAVAAQASRSGIATAFDVFGARSLELARRLGARAVKIHATDFFHDALVGHAIDALPEVFFSAAGIHLDEIRRFVERCGTRADRLTLLHGFQAEPTATGDNHLRRIAALAAALPGLRIGFMDHAEGSVDEAGWLGVLAVPFGVTAIEKHITVEPSLALEDSVSALDPVRFARYVQRIRSAEAALGRADLALSPAERTYRRRAVKVVVAAEPLGQERAIEPGQVRLLRAPLDDGREPMHDPALVVGRRLRRLIAAGEPVYAEDLW